ncbi:MAG: FtsX-like permease family protein [Syntrophomonadaceae bacterium]|nr:FtsX-like permease family protein [Syntrophomonadaceae bacterium]
MLNSLAFEINLAYRFLRENKIQTLVIFSGIALSVAVMVFLSGLIDGLQANMIEKTIGRSPHLVMKYSDEAITDADNSSNGLRVIRACSARNNRPIAEWQVLETTIAQDQRIKTLLPVIDGSALVSRGSVSKSVMLRGFDLIQADRIYGISPSIIEGNRTPASGSVLIGKELAQDLGVSAGEPVFLELSGKEPRAVMVDGIFDLGSATVNQNWLVMDRRQAAALLDLGDRVTSMEIQVFEVFQAAQVALELQEKLPDYHFNSWQETNAQLLSALKSQSKSSYTIQFFVLLAVSLGVASVLAISAVQKSKQIGILKAIGMRTGSISRVFMIQGMVLGFMGILLGFVMGIILTSLFIRLAGEQFTLLLKPLPVIIILVATLLFSTMAAYLPARRVSQLNPIEVIRNG